MDTWTLDALVAELEPMLARWQVREGRAYAGRRLELVGPRNERLVISCAPQYPALFLTRARREVDPFRPWQSGRIAGTTVVRVERWRPDRMLTLHLDPGEGRDRCRLVVELLPRHANALLLDASNRILDVLRRVPSGRSRVRQLLPGLAYAPPPQPDWITPDAPDPAAFTAAWRSVAAATVEQALARLLPGAGTFLAREIAHRAGIGAQSPPGALAETAVEQLYALAHEAYRRPHTIVGLPTILLSEEGAPIAATILELTHLPPTRRREAPSVLHAVETVADHLRDAASAARSQALWRARVGKAKRTVEQIEADLRAALDQGDLKAQAELLLAHAHQVPEERLRPGCRASTTRRRRSRLHFCPIFRQLRTQHGSSSAIEKPSEPSQSCGCGWPKPNTLSLGRRRRRPREQAREHPNASARRPSRCLAGSLRARVHR